MAQAQPTSDTKAKQAMPEAPKPQTYVFTVSGRPDGKLRKKGDSVEMLPAQAKYLLQMQYVKPVRATVKTPSKPASKSETTKPSAAKKATTKADKVDGNNRLAGDPAQDEETPSE